MVLNSNNLIKINLEQNPHIEKMYNFYINKFKILGGQIYKHKKPHSFNDIENFCKEMDCFATFDDDEEENYAEYVIYYENEICITDIRNNMKIL